MALANAVGGLLSAMAGGAAADRPPPSDFGRRGEEGEPGYGGDPGLEGEPGQAAIQSGGEALALARKLAAIPALAGTIVLPEAAAPPPPPAQ